MNIHQSSKVFAMRRLCTGLLTLSLLGLCQQASARFNSDVDVDEATVDSSLDKSAGKSNDEDSHKHGIGEDYDPSDPGNPDSSIGSKEDARHKLTVLANPYGYGYVSCNYDLLNAGDNATVYASNENGFVFDNWTIEGEVVSEETSFHYVMPDHDVTIFGNFHYDPANPGNPGQLEQTVRHPAVTRALPNDGGSMSPSDSFLMDEGSSRTIYAYPNSGWKLVGWTVNGEALETKTSPITVSMGESALDIAAYFEYAPASPSNPGANYWNPSTGDLIVDDFTPGYLHDAFYNRLGYDREGVSSMIVKGRMTSNDFGAVRDYGCNATVIDLSRVGGVTTVPYWAFEYVNASSIILPSTITEIQYGAFYQCPNLSSLTLYSQEPPTYNDWYEFGNKENCTLYVPASAIELYSNADFWKDFNILPITADTHVLQVNLPEDAADGRYRNNSLEIVNVHSGVRQKYVVSDRLFYTFNGLLKDERYDIYLNTQSGMEIGRIENVVIPNKDIEVTFDELRAIYTVSAKVLDSEESDVTSQVSVEWLKPQDDGTLTYIRKSPSVNEIPEGECLVCRVTLDNKLGTVYVNPDDIEFVMKDGEDTCVVNLTQFRSIELVGSVVDGDESALSGASVSVNQTLNGKYSKTYTAKTDRKGEWTVSVLDAPETRLTYAASECVNVNDTIGAFAADVTRLDLGKTTMKSIVGARVTYGFTYKEAGQEEESDYYSDYQNVAISVYNKTQDRAHNEVSLQYPILAVLDENINTGDELELTATSKTGAFKPIVESVTVEENQRAEVTFDIIGKGGIAASFEMTENPAVIAMLYSAKGELQKKQTYSEAKTTFPGLEDGEYTLVTMGQSDLMNSILRLSSFDEIGLKEGKDYVKNEVKVESGVLSEVKISEVPTFDESLFYYTNSTTGFSVNKSSITTGNYLTLRSAIDFKGVYKDGISKVALVVDLPEACDFVEQSVIQGPNLLPYTIDNNRLTVQLGNGYQSQTRFCVVPTAGGSFNATASIVFDYNGKTITQPIGSAISEIKDIEISVPSVIAGTSFKVTGVALGNSEVCVYENGTLLGKSKANAAGSWNVDCELDNPYNLSTHSIHAGITTPAGNTLTSETKELTYDVNALQVSKVTMYHYNPEMHKTYESVFDFMNPKTTSTKWTVYYPKKQFTYTIEFTDNDPEKIYNVVLYVHTADGKRVPVNASFDENKGLWYAEIDMGTSSNGYYPVNCSVDFDYVAEKLVDTVEFDDLKSFVSNIRLSFLGIYDEINDVIESSDDSQIESLDFAENIDWASILDSTIGVDGSNEEDECNSLEYFLSLTDDELDAYISAIEKDNEIGVDDMDHMIQSIVDIMTYKDGEDIVFDNGMMISVKTCDGVTVEELIERGFQLFATTGGKGLYILRSDSFSEVVDFDNDQYTVVKYTRNAQNDIMAFVSKVSALDKFNEIMENINGLYQPIAHAWEETNDKLLNFVDKFYQDFRKSSSDYGRKKRVYNSKFAKLNNLKNELKGLNSLSLEYHVKLGEIKGLEKEVKAAKKLLNNAARLKSLTKAAHNLIKPLPGIFAKRLPLAKYADAIYTFLSVARKYQAFYISIPNPCRDDQEASDDLRGFCIEQAIAVEGAAVLKLGTSALLDLATFGAVSTAVGSGGASLIVAAGTAITNILANLLIDKAFDKLVQTNVEFIKTKRNELECIKKCGTPGYPKCPSDDDGDGDGGGNGSGSTDDDVQIDPSGYVYEAVPDNRVEGVQATIYYKETKEDMYGDSYEEIVLWDAEEYAQQNPLFTDEFGMYQWDVPQGLWQVKFEKDGYASAYSEWLPVPPPQLEVNIGIVQSKQPEVTEARAYEEGVEVQFDKFMDLATLTTSNIYVAANYEKLNGEIRYIDSSLADEYADENDDAATRYASRVRFVPVEKLSATTGEIRLTVSRNVLSYAGIPMTETFTQVLDVEKEVQAIYADDVKVLYGGEKEVTIYALPYEAAVGRRLHIANSSDLISSVDLSETVFDEEGKTVITVKGELPGRSQLTFSIDGVTVTGDCAVDVVTEIITAEAPKSSRASGTTVYRGTKVELTSESKNATIWFTTDGSCPCDENGTRRKYTVPVVINEDTHILAMTQVGDGDDDISDIVEFNYSIKKSDMDFQMPEGWTWISHNFESELPSESLTADSNVTRILSQTSEVVRDPQLGMVGSLKSLNSDESYKVKASAVTERVRLTDVERNPTAPIAIGAGWNWIGYPVAQTMTVGEALQPTAAESLDILVGQNGFAQYDGENWIGTLETMSPGMGYMYKSQTDKIVTYNSSIVSNTSAKYVAGISEDIPYVVDIHKYPSVMPVVATLKDAEGTQFDNTDFNVFAFSGSECRGLGKIVSGLVMMSVYGNNGDTIHFLVTDYEFKKEYGNSVVLDFSEDMAGDIFNPFEIAVNTSSSVSGLNADAKVKVSMKDDFLRVKGASAEDIECVDVYDMEGVKLLHTESVASTEIRMPSLSGGAYVVVLKTNGEFSYHKIAIR